MNATPGSACKPCNFYPINRLCMIEIIIYLYLNVLFFKEIVKHSVNINIPNQKENLSNIESKIFYSVNHLKEDKSWDANETFKPCMGDMTGWWGKLIKWMPVGDYDEPSLSTTKTSLGWWKTYWAWWPAWCLTRSSILISTLT